MITSTHHIGQPLFGITAVSCSVCSTAGKPGSITRLRVADGPFQRNEPGAA